MSTALCSLNPNTPEAAKNYLCAENGAITSAEITLLIAYGVAVLITFLVLYVLLAIALRRLAKKTKTRHAWFAWVPILNIILMFNIAGFSGWWVLLFIPFMIPIVGWIAGVIFIIYLWMRIAKAVGKPDYLGLFIIIPFGQIILPLYLAFSE